MTARQRRRPTQTPETSASRAVGSQVGGEMTDNASKSSGSIQQQRSEREFDLMVPEGSS